MVLPSVPVQDSSNAYGGRLLPPHTGSYLNVQNEISRESDILTLNDILPQCSENFRPRYHMMFSQAWLRKCKAFVCRPHSSERHTASVVVLLDSTALSSSCGYLLRSWLFLATFICMAPGPWLQQFPSIPSVALACQTPHSH